MKIVVSLILIVFVISCQNPDNPKPTEEKKVINGFDVFKERCVACHGLNGSLGFSGAKDLTKSTFTIPQIINQVTNGKGAMSPFKNILSDEEIQAVSEYCNTLKK